MKSLLIVGADSDLGRDMYVALRSDFEVITDSCVYGLSEALQRGQLIDQMRRFGPFEGILFCLDVGAQRELNYAVDLLSDLLAKPWLALSVWQELYPEVLNVQMIVSTPVMKPQRVWFSRAEEQALAATIVNTAVDRFRYFARGNVAAQVRECHGVEATLHHIRKVLK